MAYTDGQITRYTRHAVWVALLLALYHIIMMGVASLIPDANSPLIKYYLAVTEGEPLFGLFDIGILTILAYFISKYYRGAAILFSIYVIVSASLSIAYVPPDAPELPPHISALTSIIFVLLLFVSYRAIRASFAYQKANPSPASTAWWVWLIVGLCVFLLLALGILGTFVLNGTLPSTRIELGKDVPEHVMEALYDYELINNEETLDYYYSYGLFDHMEAGLLMTNNGLVYYFADEEEDENGDPYLYVTKANYEHIHSLTLQHEGSLWENAIYLIHYFDEELDECSELELWLSIELRRDKEFINKLRTRSNNLDTGRCAAR